MIQNFLETYKDGHEVFLNDKERDEIIEYIKSLENKKKNKGTYECFHCLHDAVVWQGDYDYEDYGYIGEGIVQILHCSNCGADIEYDIPITNEDIEEPKGSNKE